MASRPWSEQEFSELLENAHTFLVTQREGFALGRALAGEAELLTIAVAPDAQRQGVGRRLVDDFQTEATQLGAKRAFLDVAADNLAALALYQGQGWQETGRRRAYYPRVDSNPQDAILMSKTLG